jgi:hypothetical protein
MLSRDTAASANVIRNANTPVIASVAAPYAADDFATLRTSKSWRRRIPYPTATGNSDSHNIATCDGNAIWNSHSAM